MDIDAKKGRLVMVIEREKLFSQRYFEGFTPLNEFDYSPIILGNYEYRTRADVEEDEKFKQPIAYAAVVNKKIGKIFSNYRKGGDPRLDGFWTIGVMEHIEPVDEINGNPIYNGCLRGVKEETDLKDPKPSLAGWVNVDKGAVNRVHFGIFYIIETEAEKINLRDEKLRNGEFLDLDKLRKIEASKKGGMEYWAPFCFDYLKEYLKK